MVYTWLVYFCMLIIIFFCIVASDVSQIENLYELEVYGSAENPKGTTIANYSFEVNKTPSSKNLPIYNSFIFDHI